MDESQLKGAEEFGGIEEGERKTWSNELTAGRYTPFCNEVGRFNAGMHRALNVTPQRQMARGRQRDGKEIRR